MAVILGSWKEIAGYLGKGVRTVQRWERLLGLPVHRPDGAAHGVVLAFPAELDIWAGKHRSGGSGNGKSGKGLMYPALPSSVDLAEQSARLRQLAGTLMAHCRELAVGVERRKAIRAQIGTGRTQRELLLRELRANRSACEVVWCAGRLPRRRRKGGHAAA